MKNADLFNEKTVRGAIFTETFQIVRHFFPDQPIGVSDLYRCDDGSWTASIYMLSNGVRETYELGMLFSDPVHAETEPEAMACPPVGREFGSPDYAHYDAYDTSQREIVQRWSSELSALLQRDIDETGLHAGDFSDSGVELRFFDGSIVKFQRALHVKSGLLIAVFTEHCGYHEYALSTDDVIRVFESSDATRWRADNGVFV